jgi:2-dehydropantoate 2-reductase
VKSQDTVEMLDALEAALSRAGSPAPAAVVCLQNGVDNERQVLRRYAQCYGVCVMLPATHLEPGVVQAHSAPITGLLDIGCFPTGVDETAERIAEALSASTFDSRAVPAVMRFKYRKLLMNLLNAVEALCGPAGRESRELVHLVLDEGEAVLAAAGIDVASRAEDAERRGSLLKLEGTASGPWSGGSSWQSVARGTGRIEADYLNGEICLVGRLHGVATPVNARLQQLAGAAARGEVDGPMAPDDLLAQLRG